MIELNIDCISSLAHLIKDEKEFEKRCQELMEKDPVAHVAIFTIAKGLVNYVKYTKKEVPTETIAIYAAFLMYNLIRIQIESNDLEENCC